jgi:hypothetical protein
MLKKEAKEAQYFKKWPTMNVKHQKTQTCSSLAAGSAGASVTGSATTGSGFLGGISDGADQTTSGDAYLKVWRFWISPRFLLWVVFGN